MEWKLFFKVSKNCIFNLLTTRNSFLWPDHLILPRYGRNVMSYSILVILLFTPNPTDPFFSFILFNFNIWTFSSVLQLIRGRGQLCKYFPPVSSVANLLHPSHWSFFQVYFLSFFRIPLNAAVFSSDALSSDSYYFRLTLLIYQTFYWIYTF